MKKYKVVNERNLCSLEQKVQDLMKQGWQCQGGLSFFYYPISKIDSGFASGNPNIWHTQAMVKLETDAQQPK